MRYKTSFVFDQKRVQLLQLMLMIHTQIINGLFFLAATFIKLSSPLSFRESLRPTIWEASHSLRYRIFTSNITIRKDIFTANVFQVLS